jgi:glutamine synthetase
MAKKPAAAVDGVTKVLDMIRDNGVEYVDLRFTDPKGKWQHTAQHISTVDADALKDGFMFDGSSIAGWKAINESDMILQPDVATAVMDPFAAKPSLILFCDIVEPATGQGYVRDPRSTAKRVESYVKSSGIGDTVIIGAEAEFFIFDSVKFGTGGNFGHYKLESIEGPGSSMIVRKAIWAIAPA